MTATVVTTSAALTKKKLPAWRNRMNVVDFFSGKIGENLVDLDTFKKWFFSPS